MSKNKSVLTRAKRLLFCMITQTAANVVHMSVQCSVLLLYVQVAGLVRVYVLRDL